MPKAETKNKGGRPMKFKTVAELQAAIEEYFDYCDNRSRSMYVKELGDNISISDPAPYTMSGLAYALDIDRKTLLNYSKNEQFFPTVKRARERVERDVEERMNDKSKFTPGLIFNAKNNFGWVDKSEVDQNIKGDVTFLNDVPRPKGGDASGQGS